MATIKSYTDINQSRKLAEILPLESADMAYICIDICKGLKYMPEPRFMKGIPDHADEYDVAAWSLASLLDVLPNNENISTNLSKGGYRISTLEYTNSWFVDYEDETNGLNNCVTSADNPVDACVAMIEKLHKLKIL